MKTKEEAIQEAYGEYWDELPLEVQKEALEKNGFINSNKWLGGFGNTLIFKKLRGIPLDCMDNYDSTYCYYFRPKSLQGIENNNGWIRIESDDDLPKEKSFFNACYFNEKNDHIMFYGISHYELISLFEEKNITHYKPFERLKPPIY